MLQLFRAILCGLMFCTHEYPSDPLASRRFASRSLSLHTSYDSLFNNDLELDSKVNLSPITQTNSGAVEGYVMRSIKGRRFCAYEGIPYGESTGGPNRFKLAVPKSPWSGIRPAKKTGDFCMQRHIFHGGQTMGSEDCLFINIYTPSFPRTPKMGAGLPVIVWFHGGGWAFGSGAEYGPSYLLEHDLILVTVNHRLGVFGFLSTGDSVLPGNLGFKDQGEALKWVHENIAHFGGDPSLVTIAGHSSGGPTVHFHMISNSTRNYFSGAISMSGTAFSSWAITDKRTLDVRNKKLSEATDCPLTSSQEYVDCLRKIDARVLVRKNILDSIGTLLHIPVTVIPLAVVVEADAPGAFLAEHPDQTYARNGVAKVPWISTGTLGEADVLYAAMGRLRVHPSTRRLQRIFRSMAPYILDYIRIAEKPEDVTDKIMKFYFGNTDERRLTWNESMTVICRVVMDRMFSSGLYKSLQLHSQIAPTYSAIYAYQGRNSLLGMAGLNYKELGVTHGDDLGSYFNMSGITPGYKTTDPEYAVVKLMTSFWYNFAAKREPLYTDEEGRDHRIWEPVRDRDPRNIRKLLINNDIKMVTEPFTESLKFWEKIEREDLKP